MVARRGRLPGLRPELRRRQRRRHRRPRRCPRPAPVPARPRRRRPLVQPLVPVAAGRQRVRHRRLPRHRPGVRDARRGRAAHRGSARVRNSHHRRYRPNDVSTRSLVQAARLGLLGRRSGPGSVPARARQEGGRAAERLAVDFGGSAWTRVATTASGTSISSRRSSPTNWTHPDVRREHEDVLRFWFDRGVAGVASTRRRCLSRIPRSPRRRRTLPGDTRSWIATSCTRSIARWRAIADSYDEQRVLVGEIWLPDAERFARYLRRTSSTPRSTSTSSRARGTPERMRASIDAALAAHAPVDAPATWVLSNHDVTRPVTRYGRDDTSFSFEAEAGRHPDRPRARHPSRPRGGASLDGAARLDVRLPGRGAWAARGRGHPGRAPARPDVASLGGVDPGRDGCRVPLPWAGDQPTVRVQPRRRDPLARAARRWAALTVEAQSGDPDSMLSSTAPAWHAADDALGRGRNVTGCPQPTASSHSSAATASSVSSTSGPIRSSSRRAPTSSSQATSSKEVSSCKTRPSGSARPRIKPPFPARTKPRTR